MCRLGSETSSCSAINRYEHCDILSVKSAVHRCQRNGAFVRRCQRTLTDADLLCNQRYVYSYFWNDIQTKSVWSTAIINAGIDLVWIGVGRRRMFGTKFVADLPLPIAANVTASNRMTISADWMPGGQPHPPYLDGSALRTSASTHFG
nr:chlorophyll A-B binding protein 6, chloroplastic [Ipomoea batatas]